MDDELILKMFHLFLYFAGRIVAGNLLQPFL
ncbi:hypothetical protein SAMN05192573_103298 [Mucilaginibacter gossypii]|uniref:Uncharacterized protein n=1 Tax=Mucilaginibacter gossypii TaxID=551996 RepID=A0A1G7TXB8_9SPHI|nr:hypothetical protein SAMN05192573_103298 [Mucilaginibacter gossypii]